MQKTMIAISFIQTSGYILTLSASNSLVEPKIQSFTTMMEISSGTFLLYLAGIDTLTWFVCIFMNIFLVISFAFAVLIGSLHQNSKLINSSFIQFLASIYNAFLSAYNWVFLISFIEINVGILVTGQQCYLFSQRENFSPKPWYQLSLGIFGLVLALFTSFCVIYFFRNYEFHERMKLKRKFDYIQLLQVNGKFLMVALYYLQGGNTSDLNVGYLKVYNQADIIQFTVAMSFIVFTLYDVLQNFPYLNDEISRFYIYCLSFNFAQTLNFSFWQILHILKQDELFYTFCIMSVLCYTLVICAYQSKYEILLKNMVITTSKKSLRFQGENYFKSYADNFDFFIEEFVRLCEKSSHDEDSKYKVIEFMRQHTEQCEYIECYCKEQYFQRFIQIEGSTQQSSSKAGKKKKNQLDLDQNELIKLTESIFKIFITKNSNISESIREHLSLKYISFVEKFLNNPKKSFYELKVLLNKAKVKSKDQFNSNRSNASFYFLLIEGIFSLQIFDKVRNSLDDIKFQNKEFQKQEASGIPGQNSQSHRQGLSANFNVRLEANLINCVDEVTNKVLPKILEVAKTKIQFWRKFTEEGFKELSQMRQSLLKTSFYLEKSQYEINQQLKKLQSGLVWIQSINFLRLMQLVDIILHNDIHSAQMRQKLINDIQNREQSREGDMLEEKTEQQQGALPTNNKQINNELICIMSSVSNNNFGQLVQISEPLAKFFGFNTKQEASLLNNIKQLMPDFIAKHHDSFVLRYLDYEEAYSGFTKQQMNKANLKPGSDAIQGKLKTFAKNRLGFIFPIQIQVDLPLIINQNEFLFATSLLKLPNNYEYILFNKQGNILGISEKILNLIFREANKIPEVSQVYQQLNIHSIFYNLIKILRENRDKINAFIEHPINAFFNKKDLSDIETLGEMIIEQNKRSSIELSTDPISLNRQLENYMRKQIYLKKNLHISQSSKKGTTDQNADSSYMESNEKASLSVHTNRKNNKSTYSYNISDSKFSEIQYDFLDDKFQNSLTEFFFSKKVQSYQSIKSRNYQNSIKMDNSVGRGLGSVSSAFTKSMVKEQKFLKFQYTLYQCSFPIYLNQLNSKTNDTISQEFKDSIYFKLALKDLQVNAKADQADFNENSQNTLTKTLNTQNFQNHLSQDYSKNLDSYKTVRSFGNKSRGLDKLGKKTETTLFDSQHSRQSSNSDKDFTTIRNQLKTPILQPSHRQIVQKVNPQRKDYAQSRSKYHSSTLGRDSNDNNSLQKINSQISPKHDLKTIQEELPIDAQNSQIQSVLFPTDSDVKPNSNASKPNIDNRPSLMSAIQQSEINPLPQQQYKNEKYLNVSPVNKKRSSSVQNPDNNFPSQLAHETIQHIDSEIPISSNDVNSLHIKRRESNLSSIQNTYTQDQTLKRSNLENTRIGSNQRIQSSMQNAIKQVDSDDIVIRGSHLGEKLGSSGDNQVQSLPSAIKNDSNQSSNEKDNKLAKSQVISEDGSIEKQINTKELNNGEHESEQEEQEPIEEQSQEENDDQENTEQNKDYEKAPKSDTNNKKDNMKQIIKTMKKFGKNNSKQATQTQNVAKIEGSSVSSRQTLNSNAGLAYMKGNFISIQINFTLLKLQKELVSQTKIPRSVNQYITMLNIFFVLFTIAVFVSQVIITNDIVVRYFNYYYYYQKLISNFLIILLKFKQSIEDQLFVLRLPRQFNENFNKEFYSYYLNLQLNMGVIDQNLIGYPIQTLIKNYTGAAYSAQETLLTANQNFILSFTQTMQNNGEISMNQDISFFSSQKEVKLPINSAMIIHMSHMQMYQMQYKQREINRKDSFLYFRANIFNNTKFLKQIVDSSKNEAISVINRLTEKVIYVALICVLAVFFIALATIPIIRQNKKYDTMVISTFCTLKQFQGLTEQERLEYFIDQYQPICNSLKNLDDFSNNLIFCYVNTSFSTHFNNGQRNSLLKQDKLSKTNKNTLMQYVKHMQSQVQNQNNQLQQSQQLQKNNDQSQIRVNNNINASTTDMNISNLDLNKSTQKMIIEADETKEMSSNVMSKAYSNNYLTQNNSAIVTKLLNQSTKDNILHDSLKQNENQLNSHLSFGQSPKNQKDVKLPQAGNKSNKSQGSQSVKKIKKENKIHERDFLKQKRMDQSMQRQVENFELTIYSSVRLFVFMILMSCVFFFVICIIVAKQNSGMINPINVNYQAISLHFLSANLLVYSNLLAFDKYLKQSNPEFTQVYNINDLKDIKESLDQYIIDIPNYQSELINNVITLDMYSQAQRDQLLQLLQGDICGLVSKLGTVLTASSSCGDASKKQLFQKGTLGGIESMRTLIIQYQETLFEADQPKLSDIKSFLNNPLQIEYFIKGFDLLIRVISNLSTRINSTNIILINDFSDFIKEYYFIFGIILIFLFFSLIVYHILNLKRELYNLQSSLKLIPQDYFSDDRILHILKKLCSL